MSILYSLIARKKAVLAEYSSSSGNFPTVTRVLLAKIPEHDSKMSYVYDKYVFHYIVDQGITFLCMSEESAKRRVTFAYLQDIMKNWRDRFGSTEQTALAFSLNDIFSPVLRQRMEFFNTNPSADQIARVQTQIDAVKDVMIENIDLVLDRGEKIELLVDKTERLSSASGQFVKQSKALRNTMFYRKIRNYCIIFVVILIVVFLITMFVCGFTFDRCSKK